MSDLENFPRLPKRLQSWEEHLRRSSDIVNELLNRTGDLIDRVESLESLIRIMSISGYGAANQVTDVPNFNLGAGYVTLPFDALKIASPIGVVFNLAADTVQVTQSGVWQVSLSFSLAGHNSSNGGRVTNIRIFNVTQGITSEELVIGIGRNVEDTSASITVMFDASTAGDVIRFEIGGGDTVTGGTLNAAEYGFNFLDNLNVIQP